MNSDEILKDETPTHFYNPLSKNLEISLRDDKNQEIIKVIPAGEISTEPKWLADVLTKHLVDAIINERKLGLVSPEKRLEIQQETQVTL
jgi:hypothetical protein